MVLNGLKMLACLILDEIHLLTDVSRGPTSRNSYNKNEKNCKKFQIIGLSATIKNAEELSEWLDADLLKSNFRPVKLYQGVAYDSKIKFPGYKTIELNKEFELEEAIVIDTLNKNKQILVFCSTRNRQKLSRKTQQSCW